tara:strand:+ start:180 stop:365 length:186 start_codon:yes stop_codon:yes gene_type:complete
LADSSLPIQQRKDTLKYLVGFSEDLYQFLHVGHKKDLDGVPFACPELESSQSVSLWVGLSD